MIRNVVIARAVRHALMTGVAAASFTVAAVAQQAPQGQVAQNAAPAQQAPEDVTEVVVTGTRIVTPNSTSASPIQALNVQSIQATGQNDVSNIINQLPQIFNNDLGQDLGNRTSGLTTAGGVATADLRGLGPNRTLVLVDGRRLGVGSPYTAIQQPAPDLDQIPTFMIERIDVLTGGASSVYGSDAIAGVVNFVLKKNFQGIQLDTQIGENWHNQHDTYAESLNQQFGVTPLTGTAWDGRNRNFGVLMGTNFAEGQGNITGWLQYYHQDPVASGDRDFGQCQLFGNSSATAPVIGGVPAIDSAICGGSSNSNFFRQVGTAAEYSVTGIYPNNILVPNGTPGTVPPAAFNSQPYIYIQRQDDRYLAGFNAHYDIADYVKPYAQFSFMDDRTHQRIAPSALFRGANPTDPNGTGGYVVNCGNPLLSLQEATTLGCTPAQIAAPDQNNPANQVDLEIGRRNIEGGGRASDYEHNNYRAVLGASGEFLNNWTYDAYAQYYYVSFFNSNTKYLNFDAIDNALLVTGTHANPVCISGPPCVPYDIWENGGVTQQALEYLYATGTGSGSSTLRTYHADVTGALGDYGVKSPLARDGVDINVGWEHRNENLVFNPDQFELSGLLSGFGGAAVAINNSQSVDEGFAEIRAPIVQDAPFAKEIVINPGFRHSDYSVAGAANTYKIDVQWAPAADFRFRGSWQRSLRAPSLIELYNPDVVATISGSDPCAPSQSGGPPTATLAQCLHTVSPAQAAAFTAAYNAGTIPTGAANQISEEAGGSTSLKPEIGHSWSTGVLFTPAAVPNLSGSIDWWQIRVDGEVGVLPVQYILSNCLATGNPDTCSQIVRQPTTFSITGNAVATGGYIVQTNRNIAAAELAGIDVQMNYRYDLPAHLGDVRFNLNGSYLLRNLFTQFQGAPTYDCAGLFGTTCQTVNPRWRHIMTVSWTMPWNVEVGMNWRFIGKVGYEGNDPNPILAGAGQSIFGAYDLFNAQIGNYNYFDLFASWNAWKGIQVRAGIDNILDKDPPLVTSEIVAGGAANTYSTYDQLGRQIYLAVTAKF